MGQEVTYDSFLDDFRKWAAKREDLRLAVIIGSRARTDRPADKWSDLDLLLFTTKPERYLANANWLSEIGKYHLTFLEPTAVGDFVERRCLFDGGLDVDFVPLPVALFDRLPEEIAGVFGRGYRTIVDKDSLSPRIAQFLADTKVAAKEDKLWQPPNETEFDQHVNDFLYHIVWVAKKLCRGELWTAKMCLDNSLKRELLHMIEWQTNLTHGAEYDTWHEGRFLEKWASPDVLEALRRAFAIYQTEAAWQALFVTHVLYRQLAIDVAKALGLNYPSASDTYITNLLQSYYREAITGETN